MDGNNIERVNLSAMRGLSRQRQASSGRYSRLETQRAPYRGLGTFSMAPVQNQLSGGPPPKDYEMPVRTAAEGWVGVAPAEPEWDPSLEAQAARRNVPATSLLSSPVKGVAKNTTLAAASGLPVSKIAEYGVKGAYSPGVALSFIDRAANWGYNVADTTEALKGTTEGMSEQEKEFGLNRALSAVLGAEDRNFDIDDLDPQERQLYDALVAQGKMPKTLTKRGYNWLKSLVSQKSPTSEGYDPAGSIEQDVMESGRGIGWSGEPTGDYSVDSMQDVGPRGEFEPSEASGGIRDPSSFGNIGGEIASAESEMDVGDWDFDFDWD